MSTTTTLFGSAEAQAARALVGGTTLGDTRNDLLKQILVATANRTGGSGGAAWGSITGTLSAQTDLQNALDAKVPLTSFTGGGILATGGFTLTVPATGTAALLGTANVFSTNGAASTPPITLSGTWFTGGSGTTTKPQLLVEPAGTTSTAWSTGGTGIGINAPSGFAGRLFDFKINNSSQIYYENSTFLIGNGIGLNIGGYLIANSANFRFGSGVYFGVSSSSDASALADIAWYRDAAGVFSCRNPATLASATSLRMYGTFTDASNYVRLALNTTSTTMGIACETLGTGADNIDLTLTPAGTGLVAISNAASTDAALVSTHSARIKFNGTEYKVLLATP